MISKYDENNDFVLYDREIVTDEKVLGKPSGGKRIFLNIILKKISLQIL